MIPDDITIKLVLYDFDDTIINSDLFSKYFRYTVLQEFVEQRLLSIDDINLINSISENEQTILISHGYYIKNQLSQLAQAVDIGHKITSELDKKFIDRLEYLISHSNSEIKPQICAYAKDCLQLTIEKNIDFGIVSGSPVNFVMKLLKESVDLSYINPPILIGSIDDKATIFEKIILDYGLSANEVIYVGDSFTDYEAARSVGIYSINVNTGLDDWAKTDFDYIENLAWFANFLQKINIDKHIELG